MKLNKVIIMLTFLLAPAAAQANPLWQIQIGYTDYTQWYEPHEEFADHLLYFTELPTLTTWRALGYIVDFGENACGPCFVGISFRNAPGPPEPAQSSTPEPATFLMLGTAIMAALACLWRVRA